MASAMKRNRRTWLIAFAVLACTVVIAVLVGVLVPVLTARKAGNDTGKPDTTSENSRVYIGNATIQGVCRGSVCSWKGVRYAAAPIDGLRFAPPQDPPLPTGTVNATVAGPVCLQRSDRAVQSEDCLFVNVQRPINVNGALPVLIFIHGGAFENGAGSFFDLSGMIGAGVKQDLPVVAMTINYRLGLFGFLAGSDMLGQKDVSLNNGFRDMRQAIRWARSNIHVWGGDPDRITIWGQSAGSFGVTAQLLDVPHTKQQPTFAAAILQSGAPSGVPIDPPSVRDDLFNMTLSRAGCERENGTDASVTFACLRAVQADALRTISVELSQLSSNDSTVPRGRDTWVPVLDGGNATDGFYAAQPSVLVQQNRLVNVPIMIGDVLDEGTVFAPRTITTDQGTADWLSRVYFSSPSNETMARAKLDDVLRAYPSTPAAGSPYNDNGKVFFGPSNQYKRLASVYGDIRFDASRRLFLQTSSSQPGRKPIFAYQFAQLTTGTPPFLGVPHGSDVRTVQLSGGKQSTVGVLMARQWLSFATYHTPVPTTQPGLPAWPPYSVDVPLLLQYHDGQTALINDTFRQAEIDLLNHPDILLLTSR